MLRKKVLSSAKACVKVERCGDKRQHIYRIAESGFIHILPAGATIVPLNQAIPRAIIIATDETVIEPAGEFYITKAKRESPPFQSWDGSVMMNPDIF